MSAPDLDLLVAGAGPAGLATAIGAAQAGLRVRVLEPRLGPLDKACGEGVMPAGVSALAALGVHPAGRPFHGIRYLAGDRAAEARFGAGPGLGVRRTVLQATLRSRLDDLGVPMDTARVVDVRQEVGAVRAGPYRARYLVAADGLHSPVRDALGLTRPYRGSLPPRYGVRRHYRRTPWTDLVEVHWAADHEVYVTPVADDLVGVAVLGGRGLSVKGALRAAPALAARFEGAAAAGPDRGAGPLRQVATRRTAGRVLLVGDAAGYVDALTGEGITLALHEAHAAVESVLADDPDAYERSWVRITARYRRSTSALLLATARPAIRRSLVPAAARWPGAFSRAVAGATGSGAAAPPRPEPASAADRSSAVDTGCTDS